MGAAMIEYVSACAVRYLLRAAFPPFPPSFPTCVSFRLSVCRPSPPKTIFNCNFENLENSHINFFSQKRFYYVLKSLQVTDYFKFTDPPKPHCRQVGSSLFYYNWDFFTFKKNKDVNGTKEEIGLYSATMLCWGLKLSTGTMMVTSRAKETTRDIIFGCNKRK